MQTSPNSPQPVAVYRTNHRSVRLLALPVGGGAALFAFASIGAVANHMEASVELEPVRVLPAGTTIFGVRAPIDSLFVPSPSAGVLLIGLAALLSLGLIWLGHELDWGARPIALGSRCAALHRVRSAPRRMRSQLGIRTVRLAPRPSSQPLPAYATAPTFGQTRRRIA